MAITMLGASFSALTLCGCNSKKASKQPLVTVAHNKVFEAKDILSLCSTWVGQVAGVVGMSEEYINTDGGTKKIVVTGNLFGKPADSVFEDKSIVECGGDKFIVKRIVGVPGDVIAIRNNTLYLNNQKYIEEYTKDGVTPAVDIPGDGSSVAVPESCYYVLGDNRCNSIDSRSRDVGFINRSDIKGKVVVRLYPFSKIRSF